MDIRVESMLTSFLYILLIAIFVISLIMVVPVYNRYKKINDDVVKLTDELDKRKAECIALNQEVHDLEHRPSAAEKVARERYNLCREGEEVYLYNK